MNFLNLTGLQALLIALTTIGVVVLLFFLKLRRRRVVVGSALLWERVLEERQNRALIEKLRKWLSLLLAVTIALLIVLSAGRPYLGSVDDARPVAVVLDASLSMMTQGPDGRTRWERAVVEAERLINSLWTPAGIIVADTSGQVLSPLSRSTADALRALAESSPVPGPYRFPRFSTLDIDVYFVTDGVQPPARLPESSRVIDVFETADNVGITAFEVQVDPTSPSGFTAFIEVTNFSPAPKEVAVAVTGVGGSRVVRAAALASGESWEEVLSLEGFPGGGIQARIASENDALELDDTAYGYLPVRGELDVTLVTSEPDGPLSTLLELAPEVRLTTAAPDQFRESVAADVYVFDGSAPAMPPERPSLVFGSSPADWLPRIMGEDDDIQLSSWNDDHPVMRFVPVDDLGIDRANIVAPADWEVIASSGTTPLVLASPPGSDPRVIATTFRLDESDFPFHLGFPIFVENTLSWFSGETLPRTSGIGDIDLPAGTSVAVGLDGAQLEIREEGGRRVVAVDEPDLLTLLVDGRRTRVAANLVDPRSSNINRRVVNGLGVDDPEPTGRGREIWFAMILVATLLVTVEWWTYHRRITL